LRKPRWRAARRRELKARGITPSNRQRVWCVQPTALLANPDYVMLMRRAVPGLSPLPGWIWLRPGAAKLLCALDRAAGGWCQVVHSEFKRCALCARPLIGSDAAALREAIESSPTAKLQQCSPGCARDLDLKIWTRGVPSYRAIAQKPLSDH
jgi:hypothetical protein